MLIKNLTQRFDFVSPEEDLARSWNAGLSFNLHILAVRMRKLLLLKKKIEPIRVDYAYTQGQNVANFTVSELNCFRM